MHEHVLFLLISLDQYYRPPNNFKAWLFNMRIYWTYLYSTLLYIGIITMCLLYMYRRLKWYHECWRIQFSVQLIHDEINIVILRRSTKIHMVLLLMTWGEPPKSTVFRVIYTIPWIFGVEETPIRIGSMYGIYANIWGILMVNVTIYSIIWDRIPI